MVAVVWSRVGTGAFLTAWGCALLAVGFYARRDDAYMRRWAESLIVRRWVPPWSRRSDFEDPGAVAANLRDILRAVMLFFGVFTLLGVAVIV